MPELPEERKNNIQQLGVKEHDAFILTRDKELADKFLVLVNEMKEINRKPGTIPIVQTIANYIINKKIDINNLSPKEIVDKIHQMSAPKNTNISDLENAINKVVSANSKSVDDYKSGKINAVMFLVGQVMKEMKGQADANLVKSKLEEKLKQ
jgi:aspartyl-tRNA(Asn)/glutamyl-tRNA(Gln) amidotransferase subunit B